jgi:hypothetical protein
MDEISKEWLSHMKIAQKYSHLNGEEYLIVHHRVCIKK